MSFGEKAFIVINGEEMLVNGFKPDHSPIQQAEAIADRAQNSPALLHGPLIVQPVVLVGGGQVNHRKRPKRTWVVNFIGLSRFLEHELETLTESDIKYLSTALEEHQRRTGVRNQA